MTAAAIGSKPTAQRKKPAERACYIEALASSQCRISPYSDFRIAVARNLTRVLCVLMCGTVKTFRQSPKEPQHNFSNSVFFALWVAKIFQE